MVRKVHFYDEAKASRWDMARSTTHDGCSRAASGQRKGWLPGPGGRVAGSPIAVFSRHRGIARLKKQGSPVALYERLIAIVICVSWRAMCQPRCIYARPATWMRHTGTHTPDGGEGGWLGHPVGFPTARKKIYSDGNNKRERQQTRMK